jgi:hypothetical protein
MLMQHGKRVSAHAQKIGMVNVAKQHGNGGAAKKLLSV